MSNSGFFSQKHKLLLNFALWAKYLAWVVVIVYVFYTYGRLLEIQTSYIFQTGGQHLDFGELWMKTPLYIFSIFVDLLSVFLKGIVYFLVLKGISLGLNMVVETDINYREQKQQGREL